MGASFAVFSFPLAVRIIRFLGFDCTRPSRPANVLRGAFGLPPTALAGLVAAPLGLAVLGLGMGALAVRALPDWAIFFLDRALDTFALCHREQEDPDSGLLAACPRLGGGPAALLVELAAGRVLLSGFGFLAGG